MERQVDKINRQVEFMFAQIYDTEDSTGKNNTWKYNRAPEGYKFMLHKIAIRALYRGVAGVEELGRGIVNIYDGHEFTHWQQFPGVESRELLATFEYTLAEGNQLQYLHDWECKEYTLGVRSTSTTNAFKCVIIVWYYLRKMSWLEKLQYALIQPKGQRYRKGGPTTVERSEALDE